jgi:hypothetical protein
MFYSIHILIVRRKDMKLRYFKTGIPQSLCAKLFDVVLIDIVCDKKCGLYSLSVKNF